MKAVDFYELRILAPDEPDGKMVETVVKVPELLKAVEEDLTDLLPDGWEARIEAKERPR